MKLFSETFQYIEKLVRFVNHYENVPYANVEGSATEFKFIAITDCGKFCEGFHLLYRARTRKIKLDKL